MRTRRTLAATLILAAFAVGGTLGCSDSPTSTGSAPTISQLQVTAAQRISGSQGQVGFNFQYADPDADIDRVVFRLVGADPATNSLSGADKSSGTVGVLQAVDLPAAGTRVEFTVYVLDRRMNRSNELMGSFVAP